LKRIKKLIQGKYSYFVPGFPSSDDIKLANALNLPVFCGDPQLHLQTSFKSGSKRVFEEADIPTPTGAFEIYDEKEFFNTLSVLIANNINISTWVLKIDDEMNCRGIAYVDVSNLKIVK
jgi:hypothetical protein